MSEAEQHQNAVGPANVFHSLSESKFEANVHFKVHQFQYIFPMYSNARCRTFLRDYTTGLWPNSIGLPPPQAVIS